MVKFNKNISLLESQIEELTIAKESLEKALDILANQLKTEKIKICKGKLQEISDLKYKTVFKCNTCNEIRILDSKIKSLKCRDNY